MEAIAKYPYKAGSSSELSFHAGDLIIVTPYDNDWCRGKLNGVDGFVPKTYINEKPHSWFKGNIGRDKSEELLLKTDKYNEFIHTDGAFLLRNSENSPGDFSISVKYNGSVQHFKIIQKDDKYFIWTRPFDSFNELVDYHRHNSISRSYNILLRDMSDDVLTKSGSSRNSYFQGAYDFVAEDDNELGFRKGDLLKVISTSHADWWQAEKDGDIGLVPAKYLIPYKG